MGNWLKAGASVWSILATIVAASMAYGLLQGKVNATEEDVRELKNQTTSIQKDLSQVKENQASTDTHLEDIDKKLDALSNEQKQNTKLLIQIDERLKNKAD